MTDSISPIGEGTLVQVLDAICRELAGLVEGLDEQASVLASGDVEAIQALLDRRAAVIDQMVGGSDRIPDLLARSRPEEEAKALVSRIEGLLERLMEADRNAASALERQCGALQKELQQTRAASTAAQVYTGGSSVPPQARFSDRKV
ncbi:MAG: flagellar protein FliT [Planctomycetota bacterium]|nr:flagellar protein FliT [Planctomycetota bacterium]